LKDVRIIVYGVGAMGSNMVRLMQSKPPARVVGAIDHDPAKIGRDAGDISGLEKGIGVEVGYPPESVLSRVEADLVIHTPTAFLDEAYEQILDIIDHGMNIITICQELFFPIGKNRARAREIDRKARNKGVRITAVGINPGFVMDLVPILCSVPCWEIERLFVQRVVDFSPYGPDEMRHIGANLTREEFSLGVKKGTIGHIGLLETAAMVGHCLGFVIDELRQTKQPLMTKTSRESQFIKIEPGRVCGFKQNVAGLIKGEKFLDFRMVGIVAPDKDEDGVEMGDCTRIYGEPNVDITIKEEIAQKGGLGTSGVAVNMIPVLLGSNPGFHTMDAFVLPRFWRGRHPPEPVKKISWSESD
jgi:4-hydroxy-tetrahydrodipicolinate reductase